jgi:hypothetical protein
MVFDQCGLAMLSLLGVLWAPLFLALPLFILAVGASLARAGLLGAIRARPVREQRSLAARLKMRAVTAFLYLLQPLARLRGRLQLGLTPWRQYRTPGLALPRPQVFSIWTEHWQAPEKRYNYSKRPREDGTAVFRAATSIAGTDGEG